ncbi:MAG: hypothetical protein SWN10_11475 [Pseudomonadota bacterium]|nr:hypothetical protein [Pseudomonadota bacterium]RPH16332.1 MAG: hypothetical protein CBB67_015540 [Alteromonadaceae bacterium TMED7]|tara:strand:- start:10148 stop:10327 length:180 start_codon:yes stop_codon:yes gene_type:complete
MEELNSTECVNVSGGLVGGIVLGIIVGKVVDYYIGEELEKAVEGMLGPTEDYEGMMTAA